MPLLMLLPKTSLNLFVIAGAESAINPIGYLLRDWINIIQKYFCMIHTEIRNYHTISYFCMIKEEKKHTIFFKCMIKRKLYDGIN